MTDDVFSQFHQLSAQIESLDRILRKLKACLPPGEADPLLYTLSGSSELLNDITDQLQERAQDVQLELLRLPSYPMRTISIDPHERVIRERSDPNFRGIFADKWPIAPQGAHIGDVMPQGAWDFFAKIRGTLAGATCPYTAFFTRHQDRVYHIFWRKREDGGLEGTGRIICTVDVPKPTVEEPRGAPLSNSQITQLLAGGKSLLKSWWLVLCGSAPSLGVPGWI